jgi:hypothetical protein
VRGTQLIEALHHTTADWGRLHRWFAHSSLRAGRRWEALSQFARAAVRGHGREVASDLRAILQCKVAGRTPPSRDHNRDDAWIDMATAWIQELLDSSPEGILT